MIRVIFLILIVLTCANVEARVFKFKDENIAAYFSGTMGDGSSLAANAFSKSSGTSTEYSASDSISYTQSYEIGFLMTVRSVLTFKFGAELFSAPSLAAVDGNNASSQKLFDLTSDVSAFNPNLTVEFNFSHDESSRAFGFAGLGWGKLTISNAYTFTPAGISAFPGVTADYTETLTSSFLNYNFGIGYETLFTDNTTFYSALGYRFMQAAELTYSYSGENISAAGTVTNGDVAKNDDGSNRSLNMGGVFVGVGFRFYIETL